MSSLQGPVSGSQSEGSGAHGSSLDTSQYSPLIGNTHGTSGSSSHPGTGTGPPGSVGQPVRSHSSDEEFYDAPAS